MHCFAIQLKGKKIQGPWMNISLHHTRTKMISRVAQGAALTQQRAVELRSVRVVKTLRTQRITWIRAMRRMHLLTAQLFWAWRWAIRPIVSDVFFYENHGPTFRFTDETVKIYSDLCLQESCSLQFMLREIFVKVFFFTNPMFFDMRFFLNSFCFLWVKVCNAKLINKTLVFHFSFLPIPVSLDFHSLVSSF